MTSPAPAPTRVAPGDPACIDEQSLRAILGNAKTQMAAFQSQLTTKDSQLLSPHKAVEIVDVFQRFAFEHSEQLRQSLMRGEPPVERERIEEDAPLAMRAFYNRLLTEKMRKVVQERDTAASNLAGFECTIKLLEGFPARGISSALTESTKTSLLARARARAAGAQ